MTESGISLSEAFHAGGWLMYGVIVLALGGLALVVCLMILLRRDQIIPPNLESDIRELLRLGELGTALHLCAGHGSALAAIWEVALDYAVRSERPHALRLQELVDGEYHRQVAIIQVRAHYLLDVSAGSLLLGLFCAAAGLVRVFGGLGLDALKAPPDVIACGITQAILAVGLGLLVALAAVTAYAFLRNRLPEWLSHLEVAGHEIVSRVGRT
ncbi:MAG: MotA/TolQ/ExbB proton channel family protein [bacterium]